MGRAWPGQVLARRAVDVFDESVCNGNRARGVARIADGSEGGNRRSGSQSGAGFSGSSHSRCAGGSGAHARHAPGGGRLSGRLLRADANGDNRLLFGIVAQADGRFSLDDPTPIINTFTMRKFRPTLSGRVARYFDFKVMPDFGNGTDGRPGRVLRHPVLAEVPRPHRQGQDAGRLRAAARRRVSAASRSDRWRRASCPIATSAFRCRAISSAPKFFYAAGVFNGVPDGSSSTTDVDTNNGKDLAGRIVVQPFAIGATPPGALNGLGIPGRRDRRASRRARCRRSGRPSARPTSRTRSTATANGSRTRVTPAVFYYYKSFGGFAEYMRSTQDVSQGRRRTPT